MASGYMGAVRRGEPTEKLDPGAGAKLYPPVVAWRVVVGDHDQEYPTHTEALAVYRRLLAAAGAGTAPRPPIARPDE